MKVKIGKFKSLLLCSIHTRYMDKKYGYVDWPTEYTRFETFLEKLEDFIQMSVYFPINYLLGKNGEQEVKVHIDPWDTWSMDHTLAEIVLPMLVQLKRTKHGAPWVDPQDVPENLRPTNEEIDAYHFGGSTDPKFFERWNWVLDEMIFAFNSKFDDWEDQFRSGEHDIQFKKIKGSEYSEMVRGPNDTFEWDKEGHMKYQERISNGFKLFGKYYESLWD